MISQSCLFQTCMQNIAYIPIDFIYSKIKAPMDSGLCLDIVFLLTHTHVGPLAFCEYCCGLSIFGGQTPVHTGPLSAEALGLFMACVSLHHVAMKPPFPRTSLSSYAVLTASSGAWNCVFFRVVAHAGPGRKLGSANFDAGMKFVFKKCDSYTGSV